MARITKDKQQHLLIEAFGKIAVHYPDWSVHFYGKGDEKYLAYCQKLIAQYHLENQVFFKGVTSEPAEKLRMAEICAFPSLYEGFSLALTEAMSAGLPPIAFASCSGVNELIKNGINGYLVDDIDEFAEKLELLINNDRLRHELGQKAKRISTEYNLDHIINQWENIILTAIKNKIPA